MNIEKGREYLRQLEKDLYLEGEEKTYVVCIGLVRILNQLLDNMED